MRKLERDKFMTEEELRRLLLAPRSRVRLSSGGGAPGARRRRGAPHPNALRDFALLAVAALTGVREIELTGLRFGDLRGVLGPTKDERPGRAVVRRAKKRDRRTGGPVYEELPIPETARRALQEYAESLPREEKEPWRRVFPITTKSAAALFKYYCRRAGLSPAYSMHSLRHTRGTMLYAQHRDLKLVQSALGHSKLDTTAVYMHTVDGDAKLAATDVDLGENHASRA